MALPPPNWPSLGTKVDSDVRRAFASLKDWFTKASSEGGVVTDSSISSAVSGIVTDPHISPLFSGAIPPQIQNLTATGAFSGILLAWDAPVFANLAYVEIFRNTVDNIGTAQKIGTSGSTLYSDLPPNASLSVTYWYWVRGVSVSGIEGPFNATLGTAGHTADNPAYALEVLTGEITASELHSGLNARINLIDIAPGNLFSVTAGLDSTFGAAVIDLANTQANEAIFRAADVAAEAAARALAISTEQAARLAGIAAETTARGNALTAEASSRGTAIAAEAAARSAEIAAEASARAAALVAEAGARSAAIAAEAAARDAAILVETGNRATALLAEAAARGSAITSATNIQNTENSAIRGLITTLTASTAAADAVLTAAVSDEKLARSTAITAEALARTTLAARVTSTETGLTAAQGAITTEQGARATQDTAIAGTVTTLAARVTTAEGGITTNAAAIVTEAGARATAITAEATSRGTLAATVAGVSAALTEESLVRSTQNAAMAQDIITMSSSVLNTTATITNEAVTRATETQALSQSISLLTAGVSGGFDSGDVSYFNSTVEGWTGVNATVSWGHGWIQVVGTGAAPSVQKTGLTISGSQYSIVKLRIKRLTGTGWTGKIRYITAGHGLSDLYSKTITEPTYDNQQTTVIDYEMSALTAGGTDWVDNAITAISITLGATAADSFEIDYVAIGRSAPGASVAAITAESVARADAITAEAAARNTLASTVAGNYSELTTNYSTTVTTASAIAAAKSEAITSANGNTTSRLLSYTDTAGVKTAISTAKSEAIASSNGNTSTLLASYTNTTGMNHAIATGESNAVTAANAHTAGLLTSYMTSDDTDTAIATSKTTLMGTLNRTFRQIGAPASPTGGYNLRAGDAWYDTDDGNKLYLWDGATWVDSVDSRIAQTNAAIVTESGIRVSAEGVIAGTVTALSAQVNNVTTGLPKAHALIVAETDARVSQDTAIAGTVTTLSSQVNHPDTGLPKAHSAIVAEAGTRSTNELATAGLISGLTSELNTAGTGVKARLSTVETTTATLTESTASSTSALTAQLNTAGEAILGGLTDMTQAQAVSMAYIVDERVARVTALEAVASDIGIMQVAIAGSTASIVTEQTTRAAADSAEAASRTALGVTVDGNHSFITTNYITTATASGAIATAKSESITAAANAVTTRLSSYSDTSAMGIAISGSKDVVMASLNRSWKQESPGPSSPSGGYALVVGDTWYNTSDNNKLYIWDGTDWVESSDIRVGNATSAITVEQQVRATTIGPLWRTSISYDVDKVVMLKSGALYQCVRKGNMGVAPGTDSGYYWKPITTNLYGQYMVKVDVNGNVGGYGLANDGKTSKMYISVDEFAIINPHAVTGTIPPVVVLTTPQTYGTVTLPAGAYINGANIVEATIKGAAIENLAVDTAKISDAAIVTAKIADGSITDLKIGNIIQSDPVGNPYSALNHTGWLIAKDGGCHFNGDSSFSGKVTFTSNPRNSAGNLITVDNNSISIVEQNLVSNSTFTADSDWTFVSVGHAFSGADAARHLSLNATQSDGAALNALAKNALTNFTKAPTFGSTILIVPDAPYTSAYTGVMSGVVTGVTPFTNYRIDVYATTDIDYLQSSCVLDAGGAWTATAYGTGLKTMKLVLISSGAIIAEFYDTTGIVRSYDVPSSDPGYIYIKDRCYTYDHAVAISAACCMGDMAFAELLVDGAITIMTQNSNSWPFAVGHKTGVAPDFPYIRTGALAWGVYALAYFLHTFPTSTKAAAVTTKLDLLTAVLTGYIVAEEGYQQHLVRGGTGRYVADVFDPTYGIGWCSTEHNIDTWFALDLAATVRSNSTWRTAADNLKAAMLANCWLESEGRFVQGVSSQTVKDTNHALDCSSWGSILLTAWGETTKSARALEHCDAYWTTSGTVQGYRPYTPAGGYPSAGTGVWAEGTFGVVAARFAAGQLNQGAGDYMPLASIVDERGLPYSTERDYLYELSNWYSVAAIGWMQIAVQPNAFWHIDQDNAQYLSAAGSLIGGGYARSSNITVEPNTEYLLAMNMKSSDGTSVVASGFGVQDSSGAYSFGYYGEGTDVNLTSAWDRHYFRFTTPAALTSVHIRLRPPTVVGSATIDYDNIVLGKGNTESLKLIGVEAGATVGATAAQAATLATAASNASSSVAATNNWVKPGQTTIDGNKIWTGDAYVDTLQIMDNAVTFSSATSRNTQQSFAANSAWADYLTWEYVNPFSVAVSVNIIVTYVGGNTLWLGSTPTIFQVRVVDNIGTVIFDTTTMLSATLVKLLSIPANTNRTYSIQMRNDANVSSATGEHASILLIGAAK